MSGLLSDKPSPGSVRLAVGGFVLMFVQTYLLMLTPGFASDRRAIVWILTLIAGASLIGAIVGLPDPPPANWRGRHDR